MARVYQWIGLAALSIALTGCVTQEKYAALKLERDQLAGQLGKSQSDINTALAEAEIYKQQLAAIQGNGTGKDAMIANLSQQNGDLQKQMEEINRRYSEAMGKFGNLGTALSPALTSELNAFALANPDLVDFDASRGVVKFKSDVTFSPGSAEVTPKARDVIARFSEILNSSAASGYELMVAGHTDSTPVSNPATKAKHPDNWYLSAHRAIGVAGELFSHRVSSNRLSVAGFADQRPIASNTSESGKALNRRVEVLILPTTSGKSTGVASGFAPSAPRKAAPAQHPVLNKDTAVDARTPINK